MHSDPDHTILVTLNSFFTTPLRQEQPRHRHPDLHTDRHDGRRSVRSLGPPESGITDFDEFVERVQSMDGEFVMGGTGCRPGGLDRHRLHVRTPTISTSTTSPMMAAVPWRAISPASRSWRP
jgi:hypothetical protein